MKRSKKLLLLKDYAPRSELIIPETPLKKAKFPVIDIHNHLGGGMKNKRWRSMRVSSILKQLDSVKVKMVMNLDGGRGAPIEKALNRYSRPYPDRFIVFTTIDWKNCLKHSDPGKHAALKLEHDIKAGAQGLKIFKSLGLRIRDQRGRLVMPHDTRLSPVWETAADLCVPVLIHTADPPAFFRPLDRFNDRYDGLNAHPDWHFCGKEFPSYKRLLDSQRKLFEQNPQTIFISAHVASASVDLAYVSKLLDRLPNVYVDTSARIDELARQPYTARKFLIDYSDRVLFGTDLGTAPWMYRAHFRVLETFDEYMPSVPTNKRWMMYGLGLPDRVLKKIYYANAKKLLRLQ